MHTRSPEHCRNIAFGLCAVAGTVLLSAPAVSQTKPAYPTAPVKLVVPFEAGGMLDTLARFFGNVVTTELGQALIVENRPGAAGRIEAGIVSQSAPDGQTLLFTTIGTMSVLPLISPKLAYDPERDFRPLAALAQQPSWLQYG